MIALDLVIILLLILLNGFFAMSEMAMVSARKARLRAMADAGHRGAAAALELTSEPGRFLSAVQVGISLIGILAGAFGGATLSAKLAGLLARLPALAAIAEPLAFGLVVALITYFSLIIGELVPKRLALGNAEAIAARVARPMRLVARITAPVVHLLDASTRLGLRLLGGRAEGGRGITAEELSTVIAEATEAGVVERAEKEMITRIMRLGDRPVRAIMTPRPDIVWLDVAAGRAEIERKLREHPYSRYPVARGELDEVLGIVQAKDLLNRLLAGQPIDLAGVLREAPVIHDGTGVLQTVEILRQSPVHMAFAVDEYGSLEGLVTATDVLETIIGELRAPGDADEPGIVEREDGSWLIDGGLAVDEMKERLGLRRLPDEGDFHTVAGFVLWQLGHVPKAGEHFRWDDYRFEVIDMDGRRIDKILVSRPQPVP